MNLRNLFEHVSDYFISGNAHTRAHLAPFVARILDPLVKEVLFVVVEIPDLGLNPSVVRIPVVIYVAPVDESGHQANILAHVSEQLSWLGADAAVGGGGGFATLPLFGETGKELEHVLVQKARALLHVDLLEHELHESAANNAEL